jgi:hypothetical protein
VSFNGTNQYLTVPASTAFAFGTNDLTIESWCYFSNGTTNITGVICSNYGPSSSWAADSFYFGKHTSYSGKVTFWINNYNSGFALLVDPTLPPNNTWTHYAVTRYGSTWTLWRNGVSVTTGTYAGNPNATRTNLVIGESDVNANYLNGYLSNFHIVKGTALYTASFTPPTSILPAIANTSLLLNVTDSTNFIKDNGPNKFTVTNNNSATFNANGPFNQGVTTIKQRQVTDGTLEVYSNFDEFTGAPIVDDSLKLWLDSAQTTSYLGSGTTWTDLSGNSQNFTLYNSPTFSTKYGGELLFSGSNDYARIRNSSSIDLLSSSGTVEVWFRTISSTLGGGTYARLISFSDEASTGSDTTSTQGVNNDYSDYFLLAKNNNAESLAVWYKNNPAAFGPATLVNTDNYFNVVVTWSTSGASMTFNYYSNGTNTNTSTVTQSGYSINASTITIGQNSLAALTNPFENSSCAFSVVKLYNRALSSDEVSQNFNALRRRYGI